MNPNLTPCPICAPNSDDISAPPVSAVAAAFHAFTAVIEADPTRAFAAMGIAIMTADEVRHDLREEARH